MELAHVDEGYRGEEPAREAAAQGIELEVVKHSQAKRGFVLLPRRRVVERSLLCLERALSQAGPRLLNGFLQLWQEFTSLPSPASCSPASSLSLAREKVKNTL